MPQREADGRLVFVSTPYAERLSVLITHETALRQKRDQVFELTAS
ncbi:hypothetical protein FM119_08625 [Mycetocola reblochoni REB411]|uniref:Uncharacterized protein n=2 Tax=Mycetocola reblochoni TaxID=331618 RepID=A0A1R4JPF4_9MICO|nr:hypothetical protein FM119_08625 [Mycetocola reblochoni REB411]